MKGSPPRVRGKARSCPSVKESCGITPACAGKRRPLAQQSARSGDHPRVCGEKLINSPPLKFAVGSPPRVRGKALKQSTMVLDIGITPACAGKRARSSRFRYALRDHPRVCGEKQSAYPPEPKCRGSPPRVRGKDSHQMVSGGIERITPACAGKRHTLL